ncbi:GvpL/GvpF family gas vesicle protein [Thalassorhabdus alkalitolerans]|uniref:GvpL/GvpF family gas vesicle protein n=1 Tax=Thalassorhabdus alkalitolerans TaxID=2282697 RepID=A0ABW0YPH0_9BACI
MSTESGKYLFCIIQTNEEKTFGKAKLAGEHRKVYTISHKGVSMVVADAPVEIYEPSRQNVKAHQEMVASVMEQFTVIPMSFGNVLKGEEDVKILLEKLLPQCDEIFPRIDNKIEVGLKLIGKKEWIEKQAKEQPALKHLESNVAQRNKDAGYYEKIRLGEAARNFMVALQVEFEEEIFNPLAKIADAAKSNEAISERMLLNGAFLVDKEKEEEFDKKVNELYEKWKEQIDFKYTGPWPAYNFIDIKLKAAEGV